MDFPVYEGGKQGSGNGSGEIEVDLAAVSSAALTRLVEEVRNNEMAMGGYDRVHNRHNR